MADDTATSDLARAVNEAGRQGKVSAFAIDAKTGKLTALNDVSSGGSGPCHLAVDQSGKWLFVAYTPASAQNVASTSPGRSVITVEE